jgi:hypothetical protein
MKIKMILPALIEAESPFWRPIKYSLFPPIGLAILAAYLSPDEEKDLQEGYLQAYRNFYRWPNIMRAGLNHTSAKHIAKHLLYTGGWKKMEPMWNMLIKARGLNALLPMLEFVLSKVTFEKEKVTHTDFKVFACLRPPVESKTEKLAVNLNP